MKKYIDYKKKRTRNMVKKEREKIEKDHVRIYVLPPMFVTAPVFHLEVSLLNAPAPLNTAQGYRNTERDHKNKKRRTS